MTAHVQCSETITGQGNGNIIDFNGADSCNPIVRVAHSAGCLAFNPDDTLWFNKYQYYFATVILIMGLVIAFGGRRFFPYIAASVISLSTFFGLLIALQIFGWMSSTWSVIGCIVASLIAACAVGCFIRRCFWLQVTIFGGIVGNSIGVLICSFIQLKLQSHGNLIYFIICPALTLLGLVYAYRQNK